MEEPGLSWTTVSFSDSSAVKFVGNWMTDSQYRFRNASYSETTPASVAFTFHGGFPSISSTMGAALLISFLVNVIFFSGTSARVVGFVTYNVKLSGWITQSPGRLPVSFDQLPTYNQCTGPNGHYPGGTTSSGACPPAFYTTEVLSCNQHTLNLTVMQSQTMQIHEFGFVPCELGGDQTSTSSTPASASASSPTSVIAATNKQTLGTGAIVGVIVGALAVLFALSSLAFLFLRRRRRRHRTGSRLPSPSSPPSSPSPFLIFFSRSRPWIRLPGRQPKPRTPSAEFLASASSSSPAAYGSGGAGGRMGQGRSTMMTTTMTLDAFTTPSGSPSAALASVAPVMMGSSAPLLPPSAGHARDREGGETTVERQSLRPDVVDLEQSGLAVTRGYLPDSKELMAWQEREQATGAQSGTRASGTIETLPQYQTRRSLRLSS
ncbi:hypothetical protein BJY52DRAFT_1224270 [Lactarius psammicola]|nr:hypothetical protein BJY52DRAFT_1224270 [Lactarius psammicola]